MCGGDSCCLGCPASESPFPLGESRATSLLKARTVQMLVLSDPGQEWRARGLSLANQMLPLGPGAWSVCITKRGQFRILAPLAVGAASSAQNPVVAF